MGSLSAQKVRLKDRKTNRLLLHTSTEFANRHKQGKSVCRFEYLWVPDRTEVPGFLQAMTRPLGGLIAPTRCAQVGRRLATVDTHRRRRAELKISDIDIWMI